MPKYGLVVFDLDGTLLDTIGDLGAAVNHARALHGFPLHAPEEYPAMVGHGIRNLIINALPAVMPEIIDSVLADFTAHYSSHIDIATRPYPGMVELVQRLDSEGVALAVASNKFQAGAERLVAEFFPGIPWVAVLGNRPGAPLKPDPAIIGEIISKLPQESGYDCSPQAASPQISGCRGGQSRSVHPLPKYSAAVGGSYPDTILQRAVMVGDSPTDIATAHNGGIPAIAVTWGYRPAEALSVADHIATTPSELISLLGL